MKKSNLIIGLLALGLMSEAAMASKFDEEIYKALNVNATRNTPQHLVGVVRFRKSVAGLVCEVDEVVSKPPQFIYTCALYDDGRNNEVIYKALNVEPENTTPADEQGRPVEGYQSFTKRVGLLTCTESHDVVQKPVYDCFF